MTRPSIAVVGSANTDLTVLADRLPGAGETVLGRELVRAGGGKGANQAVAAARSGAHVAFVGRVGDDDFGRSAVEALRAEGIDTSGVRVDESHASGVALIVVDRDGENLIAVAPGANRAVSPADVEAARALIAAADLLLVQLEVPFDAVRAALSLARSEGVTTVLNPAPAPDVEVPRDLLRLADYLTPNLGEARRLLGGSQDLSPEALAPQLAGMTEHPVVVTLGAQGAVLCTDGACSRVASPRVKAVDTVGAGDCFCGALAVALSEGRELREAVGFAVCAAAISVQTAGAQPSLPRRPDIDALFSANR